MGPNRARCDHVSKGEDVKGGGLGSSHSNLICPHQKPLSLPKPRRRRTPCSFRGTWHQKGRRRDIGRIHNCAADGRSRSTEWRGCHHARCYQEVRRSARPEAKARRCGKDDSLTQPTPAISEIDDTKSILYHWTFDHANHCICGCAKGCKKSIMSSTFVVFRARAPTRNITPIYSRHHCRNSRLGTRTSQNWEADAGARGM